jgi:hypothetical protein
MAYDTLVVELFTIMEEVPHLTSTVPVKHKLFIRLTGIESALIFNPFRYITTLMTILKFMTDPRRHTHY